MQRTQYNVTASFYTPEPDSQHLHTVTVSLAFDDSTPRHEIDDAITDAAFAKFDEEHGGARDVSIFYGYETTQLGTPANA